MAVGPKNTIGITFNKIIPIVFSAASFGIKPQITIDKIILYGIFHNIKNPYICRHPHL